MKFGVIRFPGSCDEVDAQRRGGALRRRRAALAPRPRPQGRRRGHRPGRVLLRRLPARGRDRALRAGDGVGRRVRQAAAARCSASATASRCCARRACCRARCSTTCRCASSAARSTSRSRTRRPAWTQRGRRGPAALDPDQAHDRPLVRARRPATSSSWRTVRSSSATRRGRTRTGRCTTSPGVSNEAGNVVGLMPHPEHAVDPLARVHRRRPAVRVRGTGARGGVSVAGAAAAQPRAPRAGPHRLRVRADLSTSSAASRTASSSRSSR